MDENWPIVLFLLKVFPECDEAIMDEIIKKILTEEFGNALSKMQLYLL